MKKSLPLIPVATLLLALCVRLNAQTPSPLIHLNMDAASGVVNSGTTPASFNRSSTTPLSSTNIPPNVGGTYALDFGTTTGNYFVESTTQLNALRNMTAFTITGWINSRSTVVGSGGNRIVSWINNGGEGVDLVYQNNGSLRIGIDAWPDGSPAFSSANKVPANASAPSSNWVFFAVTYQSTGQVSFYFGNQATDAVLDVTRNYAQGNTGNNIGNLAIGAFNSNTRGPQTYDRMFRGLVDNIQIHNVALTAPQIVGIQRGSDTVAPSTPTNLATTGQTNTSVSLTWSGSTDNIGVTGYEVFNGTTLMTAIGTQTSHELTGLTPGTTYSLNVKARDAAGNRSAASNTVVVTTSTSTTGSETPPLVWLRFDYRNGAGSTTINDGTLGGNVRLQGTNVSTNLPLNVGGRRSTDFGTTPFDWVAESSAPLDQLKNLSAFTLTGWLNCKSNVAGSGGNRIISWINNGGDGVDLVYQSNGSLRLGVDQWPDGSPAFSSAGKVPANAGAPASNWIFFAVTYQSSGVVQFYFGDNSTDATLDVARTYNMGTTGSNISNLAVGNFNIATRNSNTIDRMFRGLIDEVRVHTTLLSAQNIVDIQRRGTLDRTPPTAPTNLAVSSVGNTSANLTWNDVSTDNYDNFINVDNGYKGAGVVAYDVYNGASVVGSSRANFETPTASLQLVGLTPNTTYNLTVRARDLAGNLSAPTNAVQLTTGSSTTLEPLIDLALDASPIVNTGILIPSGFSNSAVLSNNIPSVAGNVQSLDFASNGTNVLTWGNVDQLKNLDAFTLTGWLNARSAGNIISWQKFNGQGVNLRLDATGSLVLHVDQLASETSPAISSAKVTLNSSAPASNWVFFAVTYQSNGQTSFYFGNNSTNATLDVVRTLSAGRTGTDIDAFYMGHSRSEDERGIPDLPVTGNFFNGLIDDVHVFASALSLNEISSLQGTQASDTQNPTASILSSSVQTPTTISVSWTAAVDNVGVTGYELFNGTTLLEAVGTVTYHTLTGLTPGTMYSLTVKARDAAGNRSPSSNVVVVMTSGTAPGNPPAPLVWLPLNFYVPSESKTGGFFYKGSTPVNNAPFKVGGERSLDFGTAPSQVVLESPSSISTLTNLEAFTLTGWLNCKSNVTGTGGNRVISWINNGGDGVDLVYQSDGSLRLGVDEWPDASPAFSSPGKVTTNAGAPASNWIFFAVTYQSNGAVQFYFGDNATDATLDVTRSYPRGATGSDIANLAIGHHNMATRSASTADRVFRGLIDEVHIYNVLLSAESIVDIQRSGSADETPPTQPTNLAVSGVGNTSATLSWNVSSDNYAVVGYDIYNGATVLGSAGRSDGIFPSTKSFQLVGLTPNTSYNLTVRARDAVGNLSDPSNSVQLTTGASTALEPLIHFTFDEPSGSPLLNSGLLSSAFGDDRDLSDNIPALPGNVHSYDFDGFGGVGSNGIVEPLKNLDAFTIAGWVNARGVGNLISWQRFNSEGVNLQVDATGSLVLHVDQAASEATPAKSSAKVPINSGAPVSNWVFFAVTYQSNGQASFYFGNSTSNATLDVVATLPAGRTGTDIESFIMGFASMTELRGPSIAYNYFNGLADDVYVFASALSLNEILALQQNGGDHEKPTPPSNVTVTSTTASSAVINWAASSDNVGVTGYEISTLSSNNLLATVGPVTTYTMTNLQSSTYYYLKIVAIDANFNRSDPTVFNVRTNTGVTPLIQLHLDEPDNVNPFNTGSLPATFVKSSPIPSATALAGGSMDFGVTPGNNYIESTAVVDGLKSLNAFTITGWINNRSSTAGSGGNRIVSWINNGGDGVDLVYQSNGSLRIGIDGWPDWSPAVSSSNKVPTDFSMSTANWVYFAVTYSSAGEVKFYFGNSAQDATLDVTRAYAAGVTGSNIAKLAVGNFNNATRNPSTWDRMFRGVIDEIQIFNTVLTVDEIIAKQRGPASGVGRKPVADAAPPVEATGEVVAGIEQNNPNPYHVQTNIPVALPHSVSAARLLVYDATGRVIRNVAVVERGEFTIQLTRSDLGSAGVYLYSLIADGKVVGTKRMAVTD